MTAYWVTFDSGESLCVEAKTEKEAVSRVSNRSVKDIKCLPYPAMPRLEPYKSFVINGQEYHIPSFCWKPNECAGKYSCPQRYACND